jgi:tRNA (cmo5U34)-methyltransferase
MRETTRRLLAPFADRVDIKPFRLEDPTWLAELPASLSLVVSSLVVHHLDGTGKQRLFSELFRRLAPGGAVLICDVVLPASEHGRRVYANAWDAEVRKNSQTELGNQTAYDEFVSDKWNMYAHPIDEEDIDHPSTLLDQLEWLKDAGFEGVDCWWSRAGHAIFGGYKPISDS